MNEKSILMKDLFDLAKLLKKQYHNKVENFTLEKYNEIITKNNTEIMYYLRDSESQEVHPKDIEKVLGIKPSTATEALNSMEAKGLIQKTQALDDSRYKVISLTLKGKSILDEALKRMNQYNSDLLDSFSVSEMDDLQDYISRIKSNFNK